MPKPVYILCSESGAEDRRTRLVSHFNVLEKITLTKNRVTEGETPIIQQFGCRMTAVWIADESDPDDSEFDGQVLFHIPPSGREQLVAKAKLAITPGKFLLRLTIDIVGPPPVDGAGMLRVEARIRRMDGGEWVSQSYPILVDLKDLTADESAEAVAGATPDSQ